MEQRSRINQRWCRRGTEAYASTFWEALDGLSEADIERARSVGSFSRRHELEAGENVASRDGEYLVTVDWLTNTAKSIGYHVVLSEPVNSIGEKSRPLEKTI